MAADVLTYRALNRATLDRQLLLRRVSVEPVEAVGHLVGLQAQNPVDPDLALWSRLADFDPNVVGRLVEDRSLVRIVVMRGTIHLVTADDALFLRPLMQRVPPVPAPSRAVSPRGVWGQTFQVTSTPVESWLGRPLVPSPPIDRAVLRYLAAFGPATVADVATWSRLTGLREMVERLRPQLPSGRSRRPVQGFGARRRSPRSRTRPGGWSASGARMRRTTPCACHRSPDGRPTPAVPGAPRGGLRRLARQERWVGRQVATAIR